MAAATRLGFKVCNELRDADRLSWASLTAPSPEPNWRLLLGLADELGDPYPLEMGQLGA